MNWTTWLKGLAAAALGGASAGAVQAIQGSGHVTTATGIQAGLGALVTVLAYLSKSPLTPPPAA